MEQNQKSSFTRKIKTIIRIILRDIMIGIISIVLFSLILYKYNLIDVSRIKEIHKTDNIKIKNDSILNTNLTNLGLILEA